MEQKVYITEDAVDGIAEALAALDLKVSSLLSTLEGVSEVALANLQLASETAAANQTSLWNAQTASADTSAKEQQTILNKAYNDPDENLEELASKAYSATRPIFRSSPNNQAKSFRKHVAQNRFFAHDGIFLDPSARVYPWYISNPQKFVLQTALEARHWSDFFA